MIQIKAATQVKREERDPPEELIEKIKARFPEKANSDDAEKVAIPSIYLQNLASIQPRR